MANLKDFFNKVSNDNRIFTREDIGEMTNGEFSEAEKAINYQMNNLGIPASSDLANSSDVVYVHAYTKGDGTKVRAHYRSKLGGAITGAAAMPKHPSKADFSIKTLNPEIHLNNFLNSNYPEAREMANIYLVKPKNYFQKNQYQYTPPAYSQMINKIYGLTGNKRIPENWPGFILDKNSALSQNASNSVELQTQIRKKYNKLTNKFEKTLLDVNFKNAGNNLNLALGHATIINPYIDKDGNFNGLLFDKYDFDFKFKDYYTPNYKVFFVTTANNYFALKGVNSNRNYYIIAPIKFKW